MSGKKILIVDDEPQIAKMLAIRLQAQGYQIYLAGDGEKALKMVETCLPDLIILDVMMPRLDGFEVCRRLKNDRQYRHIPIIMLSVKVEQEATDMGMVVGADDYLPKPFDAEILLDKIKTLLKEKK